MKVKETGLSTGFSVSCECQGKVQTQAIPLWNETFITDCFIFEIEDFPLLA